MFIIVVSSSWLWKYSQEFAQEHHTRSFPDSRVRFFTPSSTLISTSRRATIQTCHSLHQRIVPHSETERLVLERRVLLMLPLEMVLVDEDVAHVGPEVGAVELLLRNRVDLAAARAEPLHELLVQAERQTNREQAGLVASQAGARPVDAAPVLVSDVLQAAWGHDVALVNEAVNPRQRLENLFSAAGLTAVDLRFPENDVAAEVEVARALLVQAVEVEPVRNVVVRDVAKPVVPGAPQVMALPVADWLGHRARGNNDPAGHRPRHYCVSIRPDMH